MKPLQGGLASCALVCVLRMCADVSAFTFASCPRSEQENQSSATSAKTPLAITHVTIIHPTGAPQRDMTIVVSDGVIEWTGKSSDAKRPAHKGELVVDARRKFLIPGLWDMHTHIAGINAHPSWAKSVLIPLLVANGITGIRDMGGDLEALKEWRREIESGAMIGPHIVAAGSMLLPPQRSGAPTEADPAELHVGTTAEARAAVGALQKRGAGFIKVIQVPREAYFAVAEESRKDGITFVEHIPSGITATEASAAGQKSVEHIIYSSFALDCSAHETELRKRLLDSSAKGDDAADAKVVFDEADQTFSARKAAALWAVFRQNGTWVTPTLYSISILAHPPLESPGDPELDYLPPALQKEWRPTAAPSQKELAYAAWWERQYNNDRKLTGEMHRAGVRLLAGSDSLDRYVFAGTSLHRELQEFVAAGLTPQETLRTATQNPAEFLGRKDFGEIVSGERADMVLLEGNPMEEISNTWKSSAVVLAGHFLSRKDLDMMLEKARAAAAAQRESGSQE